MKKNVFIIALLIGSVILDIAASTKKIGNCTSYSVDGRKVIFSCDNGMKAMLQMCSPSIIKVWYEQDGIFSRNNNSFAVINDSVDDVGTVQVYEQAGGYEIFTEVLIIRINKNPFQVRFYDKYQKLLLEDFPNRGFEADSSNISCYKTLRPDEQFFGLGEKTGSLNRRGKTFKMWNSDKPCYGAFEDPLYKSIPFFMSNYGYGIFLDNTYKSVFKFGSESEEFYSFEAPGGDMVYYFMFGPDYKSIVAKYVQLTGKPIMPPKWALGFSQCRGFYTNEKLARDVATEFRKRQIPCDIIYQDIGWTEHLQDFEWRKGNYSNPQKMVSDLASQGFKMIVSQDPVISQNNAKQWKEADSLMYFTTDIRTGKSYDMPWPWGGNCGVVDFTKPEVSDWWGQYQQKVLNDGVRGFWTDMGEPAWSNEESTERLFMRHYLGTHAEIHNVYGLTWDKVVTEQFEKHNPNRRVFQMTRASFSGMQRYTFGWSGDSGDGNDVLNGWNKLAAQLPLAQSAGLGLIPFWTTDISGYCGDIKDREAMAELYIRWMQFGIFNPLSRAHHEGNNAAEPWTFGPEAEQICRDAIGLKYQLHPYFYTYARNAYDTGLPLIRALLLEYPDDLETYKLDHEFLLGKELLVAPVVEREASNLPVYFPQGEWVDYNNPAIIYKGKQWINYPVTLSTIPTFVKRGSVIPEMPVQQYIGEMRNVPVWFHVFPATEGRTATFTLYEDDGETNDYKKDVCKETLIKCVSGKSYLTISVESMFKNGYRPGNSRNLGVKLNLIQAPTSILLNSEKIKQVKAEALQKGWYIPDTKSTWSWDKATGTLWIKWADNNQNLTFTIRY